MLVTTGIKTLEAENVPWWFYRSEEILSVSALRHRPSRNTVLIWES